MAGLRAYHNVLWVIFMIINACTCARLNKNAKLHVQKDAGLLM